MKTIRPQEFSDIGLFFEIRVFDDNHYEIENDKAVYNFYYEPLTENRFKHNLYYIYNKHTKRKSTAKTPLYEHYSQWAASIIRQYAS